MIATRFDSGSPHSAEILQSLRAKKSPKQIIAWRGYKKTQVYSIAKPFRSSVRQEDVTADRAKAQTRVDNNFIFAYVCLPEYGVFFGFISTTPYTTWGSSQRNERRLPKFFFEVVFFLLFFVPWFCFLTKK